MPKAAAPQSAMGRGGSYPVLGSQLSFVHVFPSSQFGETVPTQMPARHVSVCVHASSSLQLVPSGAGELEQLPFVGSHVPAAWHWSVALQTTGLLPMHTPAWQLSVRVQALPSLQVVPSAAGGFEQAPLAGLHVPAM